jgi:hypothetical protein
LPEAKDVPFSHLGPLCIPWKSLNKRIGSHATRSSIDACCQVLLRPPDFAGSTAPKIRSFFPVVKSLPIVPARMSPLAVTQTARGFAPLDEPWPMRDSVVRVGAIPSGRRDG